MTQSSPHSGWPVGVFADHAPDTQVPNSSLHWYPQDMVGRAAILLSAFIVPGAIEKNGCGGESTCAAAAPRPCEELATLGSEAVFIVVTLHLGGDSSEEVKARVLADLESHDYVDMGGSSTSLYLEATGDAVAILCAHPDVEHVQEDVPVCALAD